MKITLRAENVLFLGQGQNINELLKESIDFCLEGDLKKAG